MKKIIIYQLIMLFIASTPSISQVMRIRTDSGIIDYKLGETVSLRFIEDNSLPEIESIKEIDFGQVYCKEDYKDTVITIKNAGNRTLSITHMDIIPKSEFDFAKQPTVIMGLDPGEEYSVYIRYKPNEIGKSEEKLRITSNAKSGVYYDIALKGETNQTGFDLSADTLDFGYCCISMPADTIVTIINTGNSDNLITIDECPEPIIPNQYEFELLGSKELAISLAASALKNEGEFGCHIGFSDKCGNRKILFVKWKVVQPSIEVEGLEMQGELTAGTISELKIVNRSDIEFVLTDYKFDNNSFSFVDVQLPFTIPANDSSFLKVKFRPKDKHSVSSYLTLYSFCNFRTKIHLCGKVRIYLINDGFEWYPTGSFPYSGGWTMNNYKAPPDSQRVTEQRPFSGDKCLRGWGRWGVTPSMSSLIYKELSEQPDIIYCECAAMIDRIGFIHVGLGSLYNDIFSTYATVDFSNHAHFYYTVGSGGSIVEDRWENDPYMPMQWYKIRFRLDYPKKEITIWMGDMKVAVNHARNLPDTRYQFFYMRTSGGYGDEGNGFYDDVKVWYLSD